MAAEINSDFGEGYGDLKYGDDEGLMPFVHTANVACGFHGGDPVTIARVLDLAQKHGVKVGAHPSLPDRPGFGRSEMNISRQELRDVVLYQLGALKGFLDARGMRLNHLKPHGKLYSMSRNNADLAAGMLDAAEVFETPLIGFAGSETEKESKRRGVPFLVECYVDMIYSDDGGYALRKDRDIDVGQAVSQAVGMVRDGEITTDSGGKLSVNPQIVAVHNDMPNSVEVMRAVRKALDEL